MSQISRYSSHQLQTMANDAVKAAKKKKACRHYRMCDWELLVTNKGTSLRVVCSASEEILIAL